MAIRRCLLGLACLMCPGAAAEASGKIDVGPIYVNMRVLMNGHTQDRLDMYGARADATLQVCPDHNYLEGLVVKPTITYADGKGTFFATGIGLGQYIPITETISITPSFGFAYSNLQTWVDYPFYGRLRQTTRAWVPYLSLDATYSPSECWMISGCIQYGWAHTRTNIHSLASSEGRSSGASYSLMVDYYITECWSVNAAWAYNEQLTHELHGTRASGGRLGLGYTY